MSDTAPLYFEARLGMLAPANAKAEAAMRDIRGRVPCERSVNLLEKQRLDGCANTTPSLTTNRDWSAIMAASRLPPPNELRQLLRYEPDTGNLFWRTRCDGMFLGRGKPASQLCAGWNTRYAGSRALGHKNNRGYFSGNICGVPVLAHRAIWAMVRGEWPEFIDHINGDRADNRLSNLRSVSRVDNNRNRRLNRNNTTGSAGVKRLENGRWTARIRVDGRSYWLGTFDTKTEAAEVRYAAQKQYGFHANHGSVR